MDGLDECPFFVRFALEKMGISPGTASFQAGVI
jgi:hypothetical protein